MFMLFLLESLYLEWKRRSTILGSRSEFFFAQWNVEVGVADTMRILLLLYLMILWFVVFSATCDRVKFVGWEFGHFVQFAGVRFRFLATVLPNAVDYGAAEEAAYYAEAADNPNE